MKISEITIGRKYNLGNFESLELRVSVAPDAADCENKQWEQAIKDIVEKINLEINKIQQGLRK